MNVCEYAHDDPELLDRIKHLLGSDEWYSARLTRQLTR